MAKLTPFGVALRKLRIDKEMRLFDLAEVLGKSTAMISAIETGRKPIPDGFLRDVVRVMSLTPEQHRQLRSAKDQTIKEVRIDRLSADNREMVAAFARRLDELPPELIAELRKEIMKSRQDEVPFKRKRRGMIVPAQSRANLEDLAGKVRSKFCREDEAKIPIVEIIELHFPKIIPEYVFDVRDIAEMGGDEGRVIIGDNSLILRRDVYDGACNGETRARFTACHELGHYILHQSVALARSRSDQDPVYYDAEWQADTFAGFLMMSKAHASTFASIDDAAERCGMSAQAATVMLSKHGII